MGLFDRFRSAGSVQAEIKIRGAEDSTEGALRLIEEGNAIEESGQLELAMEHYEAAIRLAPNLARAHMNRGNIHLALNDPEGALGAYTTAITLDPDYAAGHYNVGHAYLRLKEHEAARAAYEKAIALKPDFADAHVALGFVLEEQSKFESAIKCYRRALEISPNYARVYGNLGNSFQSIGRLEEAAANYRKALQINPQLTELHIKLGQILRVQDKRDVAINCFDAALKLDPENGEAHLLLGITFRETAKLDDAVGCLRRAISINPDNPEIHISLGDTYNDLGQAGNAITSYQRALKINPDHAVAHSNLGNVHLALGAFDDAIICYRRAIEIQPDLAAAHSNLGAALKDIGYPIESLTSTRRALEIIPGLNAARSNLLFVENSVCQSPSMQLLEEAKRFGEIVTAQAKPFTSWQNDTNPDRCLRVGFVSGDLRNHPVGHFVEGVLHSLASNVASQLEIHAYTTYFYSDSVSQRIRSCCQGWHLVAGLSDEAFANKIREDGVDILIDLSGHTAHNRLPVFAWKPAPVQVTWLGYLATTGLSAIDYLIADKWTLPESEEPNFTEKIWRLPQSYLCFTPPQEVTPVAHLPALHNGYVTFGSFNNLTKINDDVVALWARILLAVPNSRLFLKTKQFAQPSVQKRVRDRFSAHGIEGERLLLSGQVAREDYLTPYHQLDIALDPFPYPGITTSVESLWMGIPVITLAGSSFLSRQGVGLLTNAGLSSWIAHTADEYVALARKHASDLGSLAQIRGSLRNRVAASPIFDSVLFAKHFSGALRGMWKNWCSSNPRRANAAKWTAQYTPTLSPPQGNYQVQFPISALPSRASQAGSATSPNRGLLRLHIGGKEQKAGWKILNALQFDGVDYIGDVRNLSSFEDGCCEEVYASHVMEHVSQKDFLVTLKGIHRILCAGGKFYFSVPDLETLCRLFVDPKLSGDQRFHIMRMIFGGQVDDYDFHYIGLTHEFMIDYFKQAGFSSATRVRTFGLFNDTSDFTPYDTPISLNMIATK
ncbi:MAG: tetratricopeptide repeat protein [Dechloromonas sp.]|nr:tetratricopeptide repeat protein [Dechloromonas sp.]